MPLLFPNMRGGVPPLLDSRVLPGFFEYSETNISDCSKWVIMHYFHSRLPLGEVGRGVSSLFLRELAVPGQLIVLARNCKDTCQTEHLVHPSARPSSSSKIEQFVQKDGYSVVQTENGILQS
jgi:hypothetical protein